MTIIERKLRKLFRFIAPEALFLLGVFLLLLWFFGGLRFRYCSVYLPAETSEYVFWIFAAFGSYLWLLFWELIRDFFRDEAVPTRVFRVSFLTLLAYWIAVIFRNRVPLIWLIQTGLFKTAAIFFCAAAPAACVLLGVILLIIMIAMCVNYEGPIEEELHRRVRWPLHVRHERYIKAALKKQTTYIGYEVVTRQPLYLSAAERNTHVQVVGTTGSGKTLYTLFPMISQDIAAGRGVIFIDAKGSADNAAAVRDMVSAAGREKDFAFFSLNDIASSGTYNPLKHGNASQLKDKIAATIDWSEPYYQRACESALQALFMDLESAGRRVTLPELHEILKNPPPQLRNFASIAETHKRDIRTLFSEVSLIVNTSFGRLFSKPEADIDLLDIYRKGKIAYFGLDTQSYQQSAPRVGKMITQDLNTLSGIVESSLSASEKRPLAIYIDEFQSFGTRGFINALARGRSSGFWITIAHQSIGDLNAIDDSFMRQVIENTNTKIILRINDPETAQLFADSLGTRKTVRASSQIHLEGEPPKNIMGSQSVEHQYLVHPSEFKNLDPGQAVFKSGKRYGRIALHGHFPKVTEPKVANVIDRNGFMTPKTTFPTTATPPMPGEQFQA